MIEEEREKFIILLLGSSNHPIPSLLHVQKELFVLTKLNPKLQGLFVFEKHYEGPFSQVVHDIMQQPVVFDNPYFFSNDGIKLTSYGKQIFNSIISEYKHNERFIELLNSLKLVRQVYDRLDKDELLLLIYTSYPDYIEFSNKYEALVKNYEKKKLLATGLFDKGLITRKRFDELLEFN